LPLVLSACQQTTISPIKQSLPQSPTMAIAVTEAIPSPLLETTVTPKIVASPSATSSPTVTPFPSPTTTQIPAIWIDLSRFDPDMEPPIQVSHKLPQIARADENVKLEFEFMCAYLFDTPGITCRPDATLFVAYGVEGDFTSVALTEEYRESFRILVADLPASNEKGEPLQYYLKVNDQQVGIDVRYPVEGTIDLFTAPEFIMVDLPPKKPVEQGELALAVPWGSGPDEVGLQKREGYPSREGPSAMDVTQDGTIALLDHVNERVLIYDPHDPNFSSIPLPFIYKSQGNLRFDQNDQLAIFDKVGEPVDQPTVSVPRLYRMLPDGSIDKVAPVFAFYPSTLTNDLQVLDRYDGRMVVPFNPTGGVNPRQTQRNRNSQTLRSRLIEGSNPSTARLTDVDAGLAFEVRSDSPLSGIRSFEKTPFGYVVVFEQDQFRVIWFDPSGNILQDVSLPSNDDYSEIDLDGKVAIDPYGSFYLLVSTPRGIEVRYIEAP
jgi:hypothetical protein